MGNRLIWLIGVFLFFLWVPVIGAVVLGLLFPVIILVFLITFPFMVIWKLICRR